MNGKKSLKVRMGRISCCAILLSCAACSREQDETDQALRDYKEEEAVNYISVNPSFPPTGTEIETSGAFNVADFGAKGDGKTLDTAALQAALDACAKKGGTVRVPKGVYLTGTLLMGNDTELYLEKGAVLLGSPNLGDYARDDVYPGSHGSVNEGWSAKHLVVAFNARNVSITGCGAIDGNGEAFMGELEPPRRTGWRKGYRYGKGRRQDCNRPGQQIVFVGCENVRVEGVTLRNMNCWTCFIHGCVDVVVRNVKVRNDQTYINTDGFDIDSSRNVTVTGCDIETGDDAFAIRGSNGKHLFDGAPSRVCENVLISNCTCSVEACGVRVGVGQGEIKNVVVRNLDIKSAGTGIMVHSCYGSRPQRGADIHGLVFSDIKIRDVSAAIIVAANNPRSKAKLADLLFERIDAESSAQIEVSGGGETEPDNIVFRNVKYHMLPLPADLLYPRQGATFVEKAGRVEFIDCDFKVEKDEDPAIAGKRELARRAAEKPVSLVPDFKPLTIEVTEAEAEQAPFRAKNYPVDFKPGRRYRVSYFVSGRNIKSRLRGCGASSVAWLDEEGGKFVGVAGYRIVGTFDRFFQAYEFDIPKTLPENFRPEVALRLYHSSGKAVFEDLVVEEVAPKGAAKGAAPAPTASAAKKDVMYVAHAGDAH